jgi:exonuclease III
MPCVSGSSNTWLRSVVCITPIRSRPGSGRVARSVGSQIPNGGQHTCWKAATTPGWCGTARTLRRQHHDGLHACAEPQSARHEESTRSLTAPFTCSQVNVRFHRPAGAFTGEHLATKRAAAQVLSAVPTQRMRCKIAAAHKLETARRPVVRDGSLRTGASRLIQDLLDGLDGLPP